MKRRNALSLLLSLSLLLTLAVPAATAYADDSTESGSGMVISKTAEPNGDGSYTITLEAYATGDKVISEVKTDVPTDIVLVLDQSGSMADNFSNITEESWVSYGKRANSSNYSVRMNGTGSATKNLYYKQPDGSYAGVSIDRTSETVQGYVEQSNARNSSLYNSKDELYAYDDVDKDYRKVTIEESWNWGYTYTYTYTRSDGSVVTRTSDTYNGTPPYKIYKLQNTTEYTYEYYYTVDGARTTIGTQSKGADTVFDVEFYEKRTSVNTITALEALQRAVSNFAYAVSEKAKGPDGEYGTEDDVNHRIAMVGFASGSTGNNQYPSYLNSEVFIGANQYNYNVNASSYYGSAFQDMNTQAGYDNIIASKDALSASGATHTDLGIEMANGIFGANPIGQNEKRNRVLIVFTDGVPSSWSGYSADVANNAIAKAETTKSATGYGATVYTIGIFEGADATSFGNQNGNNTQKANWFMQKVSSNNGTPQSPSYYLSAADSGSLNNIFQQISDQIENGGPSTTLSESTVIKDIISPQFTLPEGASVDDISIKTYKYVGTNTASADAWRENVGDALGAKAEITSTDGSRETTTDNQVSVTGFNFAEHYVGTETVNGTTTYRGNKLVISFTVTPRAGFLGGNGVYTNTNAGVYADKDATEPVKKFDQPKVDVDIKEPTITLPDANVYLGAYFEDTVSSDELKKGTTVKFGDDIELDLTKPNENWGLEDWQTEYVNIEVKVTDKDGNEVTKFDKLMEDTDYKVSVSIKPKTDKEGNPGYDESMEGTIHVFKPELTFQDSTAYYGETVPANNDFSGNRVSEKWKNGDKYSTDTDVQMLGTKPTLDITYTPDERKLSGGKYTKQDAPVKATVKIGTDDVTAYTIFLHDNCAGKTCTLPEGYHFWVHIQTCMLTISKNGGNADEPYVFTVLKDGVKYSEVTIAGNGSETIYELPIGTYTIAEDTGWSWRFDGNNGTSATLNAQSPTGTITATNEQKNPYWLNGFSQVVENIFGVKH